MPIGRPALAFLVALALVLALPSRRTAAKEASASRAPGPQAPAAETLSAEAGFRLEKFPPGPAESGRAGAASDSAYLEPLSAYLQVRSAGFGGWADTGIYIGTQLGRYPQVHRVAAPGADRRQLTFFPRRVSGFHFNPQPSRKHLLYSQDEGGDEQFRLGLFDLETGAHRDLACPPGRVDGLVWNDSGTAFAYAHTPAGTDRWDIRLGRTEGGDTLVLRAPGTWIPMDLRPDGRKLLVQKYHSASRADLFILDLAGGGLTPILPWDSAYADHALWMRAAGSKDRADPESAWSICFTSDRDGEFHRLYQIQADKVRTDKVRADSADAPTALSRAADWDVEWVAADPNRRTLVYSVNQEGYSRLFAWEPRADRVRADRVRTDKVQAGLVRALEGIPAGIIGEAVFRPGSRGRVFGFTLNRATSPGEAYTYDMAAAKAVRWTFSEPGGLPPASFATPQLVRYPTFDSVPSAEAGPGGAPARRSIPAWIYRPRAADFPGPRPVLVLIHGGPEQQARPGFDPFLQYAVAKLGLAVVQPNVRGSSGYGRSWQKADDGYLRMHSVRDLGALLDWIGTQPDLDPARVAVSGRSYGGFMALSALIEYGGRLRAGISTVGITHFPTFLRKTSGYRRDLRRAEYGDERDPRMDAFLDSISPLTRKDRIAVPLLLGHGRNDPRVPYGESERIFAALKARKVPVWFMTFAGEGHAVRDQDNQLAHWRVMAEFLARQMGLAPQMGPPRP